MQINSNMSNLGQWFLTFGKWKKESLIDSQIFAESMRMKWSFFLEKKYIPIVCVKWSSKTMNRIHLFIKRLPNPKRWITMTLAYKYLLSSGKYFNTPRNVIHLAKLQSWSFIYSVSKYVLTTFGNCIWYQWFQCNSIYPLCQYYYLLRSLLKIQISGFYLVKLNHIV